jgi:hypothetical protein
MRPWTASGPLDAVRSRRRTQEQNIQSQLCYKCTAPIIKGKALCVVCGSIVRRQGPMVVGTDRASPGTYRPSTTPSSKRATRETSYVANRRSLSRGGQRQKLPQVKGAWQQKQSQQEHHDTRHRSRRRRAKSRVKRNQTVPAVNVQQSNSNHTSNSRESSLQLYNSDQQYQRNNKQESSSNVNHRKDFGGNINTEESISKYSEWNFAGKDEIAASNDNYSDANQESFAIQAGTSTLSSENWNNESSSSGYGSTLHDTWLTNVPKSLVYSSLDYSEVREEINMSSWPVRDAFVIGLTQHFSHVLVSLNLAGSVQLTDDGVAAILSNTNGHLQALDLSACWRITERGFEKKRGEDNKRGKGVSLRRRSTLYQLNLSSLPHLDDLVVRTLASSPYTSQLRRLSMRGCPMLSDAGFGAIKDLKYLSAIHVDDCRGLRGNTFRSVLEKCHLLIELTASGLPLLSDEAVRSIAARKASFGYTGGTNGVLELRNFSVAKCHRLTDLSVQWLVSKLWNIRAVNFSGCHLISDASLNMIARSCPQLSSLKLKDCGRITDASIIFLSQCLSDHNRHQQVLDVEPASATAASVIIPHGKGLYDDPERELDFKPIGLTDLDLSGCGRVGDNGIRALAKVSKHLRSLRLNNLEAFGDVGLQYIAKHCTQLERIELSGNQRLTNASVQPMLKKIRRCTLEGRSIGIGKFAKQSTTLAGRVASFAVNGNASGFYGYSYDDKNGKVSHTCQEPNPWLIIDLGVIVDIGWVRVVGAAESSRYVQNFPLWIMTSELPFHELHANNGKSESEDPCIPPQEVDCEKLYGKRIRFPLAGRVITHAFDRPARYIRVQAEGSGPLILAEVQIYVRGTTSLNLSGCYQLTDDTAIGISEYFVHLQYLDLSGCTRIGDTGVIEIIKECVRLKSLLLNGCVEVSDDALVTFGRKYSKISNLEVIGINNCSKVTDRGLITMGASCPHLIKIYMEDLPSVTLLSIKCLIRCCPVVEVLVCTSNSRMRSSDVKHLMNGFQLATPFDMGSLVGVEPRADTASLRLAFKLTKQQNGLRLACQAVQRKYRRLRHERKSGGSNGVGLLVGQLVVDSSVEDALEFVGVPELQQNSTEVPFASGKESSFIDVSINSDLSHQRHKFASSVFSESSKIYQNDAMFDIARETAKQRSARLAKILQLIGKPPRARKIQRCWRKFYAKKVAAIKELMRGRRISAAVSIIIRLQAIIRGIRIRRAYEEGRRKKRVAKVVADMKSGKINIFTKGLNPAIRREIASIIIQRNIRIKLARKLIAKMKFEMATDTKYFEIVKRVLLQKLYRIRGRKLLAGIKTEFRQSCAVRIQNAWRVYQSRRGVMDMRNARLAIESAARAAVQQKLNEKRELGARIIQNLARKFLERIRIRKLSIIHKQTQAIRVIWRAYVRGKAKKKMAKMKILLRFEHRKQLLASKAIQAWFRRRTEVHRMRKNLRLLVLQNVGAAIVVQRWLRHYVRPLVLKRLGRSAIRIQNMFKHRIARKRVEKMLRRKRLYYELEREKWEEWYEMERMAIRIQMAWRMRFARNALRAIKQEKHRMEAHEMLINRMNQMQNAMRAFERRELRRKSSTLIQCAIRCALARRELLLRQKAKAALELKMCLRIQYSYRSKVARRALAKLREKIEAQQQQIEQQMTRQEQFQRWKDDREEAIKHKLRVGDVVKSRWAGKHKYYPGVITRINPPGDWLEGESYEILYNDGFLERRAERVWIRFQSRAPKLDDEEGGEGETKKGLEKKYVDPIEAQFSIINDFQKKRTTSEKIKSWIPFTRAYNTRKKQQAKYKKLSKTQGQHAVFTKQRTSAKIRVGIDDIKIVVGDLANITMEAEQRVNIRKKRPFYLKVDVDLRQKIRFETDDPMSVFIWYRQTTAPRLMVDIKIVHGWELGHKVWERLREMGYEKVESNVVQPPSNMPTMWSRLPMTLWYKKHVFDTPIKDIMFSRATQTRSQEISLMDEGFYQCCQDLKLFGLDHGLQFWMRKAEKFDDVVQELTDRKAKEHKDVRDLHDVPPDVHPRAVALAAGATNETMDEVDRLVQYLNMSDKDVKKAYAAFCKLAGTDVNKEGDIRVSLNELCHTGLGFEYGAKELGSVLYSLLELSKVELIDKQFLDFSNYLKLMSVVCVMDTEQFLRFFFNLADVVGEGKKNIYLHGIFTFSGVVFDIHCC